MCGAGLDRERLRRETPRATRLRTSPAPHVPPRRDGGMLLAPIPSARAQDPLFAIGSAARRSALRVVPWRMSCHHCAAHPWLSLSRVPPSSAGWVAGPLPLPHTPTICTSTKSAKYRRVVRARFERGARDQRARRDCRQQRNRRRSAPCRAVVLAHRGAGQYVASGWGLERSLGHQRCGRHRREQSCVGVGRFACVPMDRRARA